MHIVLHADRQYKAVIFDFDGLLVNSEVVWEKVEHALLARHGREYDPEIIHKYIGTGLEEWSEAMVREFKLTVDPVAFGAELIEMIVPALAEEGEPMPGAAEMVAAIQASGHPIAIASSSAAVIVEPVVKHLGWDTAIPVRCTGDQVTNAKPAPDIYLLAAERLGVSPSDCLTFEDSLNGARAARAAGMTCIAVPNPVYHPSQFADITPFVVSSLTDIAIRQWLTS